MGARGTQELVVVVVILLGISGPRGPQLTTALGTKQQFPPKYAQDHLPKLSTMGMTNNNIGIFGAAGSKLSDADQSQFGGFGLPDILLPAYINK